MSRLVVVSNRVALPGKGGGSQGGLAVGLLGALRESGGLWFGWDGTVGHASVAAEPHVFKDSGVTYATLGLSATDYQDYYAGFANRMLWPLFHYRLNFIRSRRRDLEGYWRVNRLFARKLLPLLKSGDITWVHDYHLMPLGEALREAGVDGSIGFFLHIPFPAWDVLRALPGHQAILHALSAYNLVGFQSDIDRQNYLECLRSSGVADVRGDVVIYPNGRSNRVGVFPIGVDVEDVARVAGEGRASMPGQRLRNSLGGRRLIIGVDRLDYSKGLPERFDAYEGLLERYPARRRDVTFLQIAPPSRTDVPEYKEIRQILEGAAGHINGRFAEYDWVPLRYLNKGFRRLTILGFLSVSDVGLVTPMRDGMNLVAKEFVASQNAENPGALVLSYLAGAAQELSSAVLVNPYDIDDVTEGLERALAMPRSERQERWHHMMSVLRRYDIHAWRASFIDALGQRGGAAPKRIPTDATTL